MLIVKSYMLSSADDQAQPPLESARIEPVIDIH
jgi:hypothetical protein